jgi:hypothetical protein
MAQVSLNTRVSLAQAAKAIAVIGAQRTVILEGEPGIGKSSTLKALASIFPSYHMVYLDCQLLSDQGDFFYPFIVVTKAGTQVAKRVPLEDFDFSDGVPVIMMLDEIGKSTKPVMNVITTLMQERRIGNNHLPEGSIVYATTNLASDGVGDFIAAHASNRVIRIEVQKPHVGMNPDGSVDKDSWGAWAIDNGIDPTLLAWFKMNPQALDSYRDHDGKTEWANQYAYHPTKGAKSFVSNRSAHTASDIIKKRDELNDSALTMAMLAGACGESFARDFSAYLVVKDRLPTIEAIHKTPETALVPEAGDAIAQVQLALMLVTQMKADSIDAFVTYVKRLGSEYQALFGKTAIANETKKGIAIKSELFRKWALDNQWMF